MYKIVLSGLLLTTLLQGAASSSSQVDLVPACRSNYAPLAVKYSNPDVDAVTRQHWYVVNAAFKRDRKQMALDELREARDAEIAAIKQFHTAKRRINYFEAQRLQLQQE